MGYQLLADVFLNRSGANPSRTTIVGSSSESLSHANEFMLDVRGERGSRMVKGEISGLQAAAE